MTQVCPHCDASNRDTAQFCAQCAQPLRQTCGQCGADNPPRSRFCNKCGGSLTERLRCSKCGRDNPQGSQFCNSCGAGLLTQGGQPSPPAQATYGATGLLASQTRLAERYVILRRVGRGGMGAVYQASDDRIPGKTWAIKEMSDAAITDPLDRRLALDAFRQEAMMLATLDHPNLPKVTDHFSEGGKQYLVMDFIEGQTLKERIEGEGGGPLAVDEALEWADQLCGVLEYLHRRHPPVVFRDLKPGNVMVTPEGAVKLIDFGIVRLFKPGKASDTAFFGTAGYAPKEQYGRGQTDGRSDIYALGATLYHLLTGDDPTDHPFYFEDVRALNGRVSPEVADVIGKALADDPGDRWQSVSEMRQALSEPSFSAPPPVARPAAQTAATQPAAAAVRAATAAPKPAAVSPTSRLNFWRGAVLVVLGVVLYALGWAALAVCRGELVARGVAEWWVLQRWRIESSSLLFVVPLFGILFGPWVGGTTGLLGWLAFFLLDLYFRGEYPPEMILFAAVAGFAMGFVPAWLVKDARKLLSVLAAGIVASLLWAVGFNVAIPVVFGSWRHFGEEVLRSLVMLLPAHLVLLPYFARWLIEDKGKWWAALGMGIAASLLWVVLAEAGLYLLFGRGPWFLDIALIPVFQVTVILVPLLAFWLAGSVRRWGLYWREQA
jgi:serine/threonine-protein kinase